MVEEAAAEHTGSAFIPQAPQLAAGTAPVDGDWRSKSRENLSETSSQQSKTKSGHVTIDGARVPEAIASAFSDPSKTKKPFSYFPGGVAPDFSDNPSPSKVRRSHSGSSLGPPRPRVLPIVVDEQENMPTVQHLQYNSPMPLYSKQSAGEAYQQQTVGGFGGGKPAFNPAQSETYKLLMEEEDEKQTHHRALTPHSAVIDEHPKSEQYPHYHGYVDPYQQSPSFKRLQFVTGGHEADENVQAQQPVRAHSETRPQHVHAPSEYVYHRQEAPPRAPEPMHYTQPVAMPPQSHQPHVIDPSVYDAGVTGPPVAQHDPATEHPDLDPNFAAKLAEAERPKVPQQYAPTWARAAEQKHHKWERQADPREQRPTEYRDPDPHWSHAALGKQDKWQSHYSHYHLDQGQTAQDRQAHQAQHSPMAAPYHPPASGPSYHPPTGHQFGGTDYSQYQFTTGAKPRAKSQEPISWRKSQAAQRPQGKAHEPWLKPYIAPNIDSVHTSHYQPGSVVSNQHLYKDEEHRRPDYYTQGTWFGPGDGFRSGHRMNRSYSGSHTTQYEFGTDYGRGRGTRRDHGTMISSRTASAPSWQQTTETRRTHETEPAFHSRPQSAGYGWPYSPDGEHVYKLQPRSEVPSWAQKSSHHSVQSSTQYSQRTDEQEQQRLREVQEQQRRHQQQLEQQQRQQEHEMQQRVRWEQYTTRTSAPRAEPRPVPPPQPSPPQRAPQPSPPQRAPQPSPPQRAPPPQPSPQQRTYDSSSTHTSTKWAHESEVARQRREMEEQIRSRQEHLQTSGKQVQPYTTSKYTVVEPGGKPWWQQAAGASTKASTSGQYVDPEGHNVAYTKELYTTSDPGKDFSMLTQEEKKVIEEPLQPGVISRHVTTKYYKKSTLSNTTTTSQPVPISGAAKKLAVEAPPPALGPVSPGVTQF